jgi:hypothetical protein
VLHHADRALARVPVNIGAVVPDHAMKKSDELFRFLVHGCG